MNKSIITLFMFGTFFISTVLVGVAGEPNIGTNEGPWREALLDTDITPRQSNESEPQPINLYFMGGDGGELRVEVPVGNATTEIPCNGFYFPKTTIGFYVGLWTSPEIRAPITLATPVTANLWVYSSQGANNVRFSVQILINGEVEEEFITDPTSVSNTPTEIIGNGALGGSIQLAAGDKIGARLYYFSDSATIVGPGADSTLVVGGTEYDTHITVTANPITVNVLEPRIESEFMMFSAGFTDAFGSSKLNAQISVKGRTEVLTLSDPSFIVGGNGSIVNWAWNYKTDEAKNGEYTIIITLSYSEDNEFMAMGKYDLEFPKTNGDDDDILSGLGSFTPYVIIIIIVIVIAVVVKVLMGRRSDKTSESSS